MIRTDGWTVPLQGTSHDTPNMCASCNGPRKTSVVLQTSRRCANITTILRLKMPYCQACAARVSGAGVRMMVLFCLVTTLAVALPGAAGLLEVGIAPLLVALAGGALAVLLSVGTALVLLPKKPSGRATARGEAATVTRYDDAGMVDVFCTNGEWAQRLAASNGVLAAPTRRYRMVESMAVAWGTVLAGTMVGMVAYAGENPPAAKPAAHPPSTSSAEPASSAAEPVPTPVLSATSSASARSTTPKPNTPTVPPGAAPRASTPTKPPSPSKPPPPASSAAPKRK